MTGSATHPLDRTQTPDAAAGPAAGSRPADAALPSAPDDHQIFADMDRTIAAMTAAVSGGLSPAALALAWADWAIHLAAAPGLRTELAAKAFRKWVRLMSHAGRAAIDPETPPAIAPLPQDRRFDDEAWRSLPYSMLAQGFLATQQWWHAATHDVPGVSPHHEAVVAFAARQWLDMVAPTNSPVTNPVVARQTLATGGANLVVGGLKAVDEMIRQVAGMPLAGADRFRVGETVAVTPGKVVFRNHLIELIQYAPATDTVLAEPVLIVPAWIMKYYILDLSPHNSLIRHLVAAGHTVFCLSWRNVTAADSDLGLDDYRRSGVMAAIGAIGTIVPGRRIHAAGYCLGGTLLALVAAAMAEVDDHRLRTVTLFAAQTDFTEPGELALFIDHSQVAFLEAMMWKRGTLGAEQMAGAFQLIKSNDLIWSHLVHDHLMGEATVMTDLMAWNADSTRLPYRMQSEYLRQMFLDNDLASGRVMVDGRRIALQNIRVPIFAVGTETDHVAPWRSVYKIHYLSDTEVTFALTSGGHNAGIVSEPGHPHRHFRIATRPAEGPCLSADEWLAAATPHQGSWWPAWQHWLAERSGPDRVEPPPIGAPTAGLPPLEDAPGTYVRQP